MLISGCSQNKLEIEVAELFERLDKQQAQIENATAVIQQERSKVVLLENSLKKSNDEKKIIEQVSRQKIDEVHREKQESLKQLADSNFAEISDLEQIIAKQKTDIKKLTDENQSLSFWRDVFGVFRFQTTINGLGGPRDFRLSVSNDLGAIIKTRLKPEDEWESLAFSSRGNSNQPDPNEWKIDYIKDGLVRIRCVNGSDRWAALIMDLPSKTVYCDHKGWPWGTNFKKEKVTFYREKE